MKLWLSLILALAAPVMLFAENEAASPKPEAKSTDKAESKKKDAKPITSEDDRINTVLQGIPAGQAFQGIHIPNYSPDGKLQSLFDAKVANRIGDRELEMKDLQIEIHNPDGTTFHVEMRHSVFNFDTKILTSDTPTTIKQNKDYVINGDRAEFHLKTRFGRVIGNVKMTIFNSGNTK